MSKTIILNIPITKIDEEQRIVTGIATTEALDSQGDIVDYAASKKAFSEWKTIGNIREMHNSVAVGKGIDVQFDDVNKQIIVSSKISESADGENTWTKVKEGILTGYSIGGKVFEVVKDKAVEGANRITDYALSELSLVDNPACPEATILMVKSVAGKARLTKAGAAVVDGDLRDAGGNTVTEVINGNAPKKGGTAVPKKVYHRDGVSVTVKTSKAEIMKSVYDAQTALSLASQLAYLIMCESDEPDQVSDLVSAFNSLRDFAGKEIAEGDDFDTSGYLDAIELANKAINLRKEKFMAEKKELEKTNVIAGEERDLNAEVVTTAEEAGRPVDDTAERAAVVEEKGAEEAKVEEEATEVAAAKDEADVAEPVAEPVAEEAEAPAEVAKPGDVVESEADAEAKADSATDLVKSVETLLAKLEKGQSVELKKAFGDIQKSVGEVAQSVDALKDRVATLEKQPMPTKAQRYQVVSKGDEEEVDAEVSTLLKRQDELIADPFDAKPGEMADLAIKIRKANLGEQIKVN